MFGIRIVKDDRPRRKLGKMGRGIMLGVSVLAITAVTVMAWGMYLVHANVGFAVDSAAVNLLPEATWNCQPANGTPGTCQVNGSGTDISVSLAGLQDTSSITLERYWTNQGTALVCGSVVPPDPQPGMTVSLPSVAGPFAQNDSARTRANFSFAGLQPSTTLSPVSLSWEFVFCP